MPILGTLGGGSAKGFGRGAGGPAAYATGGTETEINVGGQDYRVHTFTGNGTLTVVGNGLEVEYLLAGGGASGGNGQSGAYTGGGGGAGGYLSSTDTLDDGTYPVVIGAGGYGAYSANNAAYTNDGNDSTWNGLTAYAGGRGGSGGNSGNNGGSGGGAGGQGGGGGSGYPGQGYPGLSQGGGGHGGGGGGIGGSNTDGNRYGLDGVFNSINGTSSEYCAGGNTANPPVYSPGSGGSAGGPDPCQSGNDGILIVRYPI